MVNEEAIRKSHELVQKPAASPSQGQPSYLVECGCGQRMLPRSHRAHIQGVINAAKRRERQQVQPRLVGSRPATDPYTHAFLSVQTAAQHLIAINTISLRRGTVREVRLRLRLAMDYLKEAERAFDEFDPRR